MRVRKPYLRHRAKCPYSCLVPEAVGEFWRVTKCDAVVFFSAWVLSQIAVDIVMKIFGAEGCCAMLLLAVNCTCVVSRVNRVHFVSLREF